MPVKKTGGKGKKILAVILATIMSLSGGSVGLKAYYDWKQQTPTSMSDENDVNNGNDDSKEETFNPEGVLYKPYSIKNDDEIQNMLNDVEKLTGEKIDIRFIKILFYEYLDKSNVLTKDDFKDITEEEFSDWFNEKENGQQAKLYNALGYGMDKYENLKRHILNGSSDDKIKKLKDELPSQIIIPYTFIPKEAPGYDIFQLKLSELLVKEKNDIESGNVKEFEKNTSEFLDLMTTILSDNTLSNGERYIVLQIIDTWLPIFSLSLNKENKENYVFFNKLIPNFQSSIITAIMNEQVARIGYILPVSEETCTNRAKENEQYIDSDANTANKNKPDGSTKNVPGKEDSNGKHYTSKEKVSSATKTTSTATYVVDVPDKEDTTNKKPGGKPTGTTSTSTETTSHIYDYDVKPGVEYSDDSLNNGISK